MQKENSVWMLLLVCVIALAGLEIASLFLWNASQQPAVQAVDSSAAPKTGVLPPDGADGTKTYLPMTESPLNAPQRTAGWGEALPCANHPLTVDAWNKTSLSGASSLAGGSAPSQGSPAYQALRLNLLSGRLNRASRITLAEFPEIDSVGELIDRAASDSPPGPGAAGANASAMDTAIESVISGAALSQPVCARLALLDGGQPSVLVDWAAAKDGKPQQAGAMLETSLALQPPVATGPALSNGKAADSLAAVNPRKASLDSGLASPDGRWAVFTSLSMDAGGPVFLSDLGSGTWVNLIARMNQARKEKQPELLENDWWTVIDWLPDSQQVLLARSDLSSALLVAVHSGQWQDYPFAGGGNGGSPVLDLLADGSGFVFIGSDDAGSQSLNVLDFASGQVREVQHWSMSDGVAYFPRSGPDGSQVAYLWQQGDPQSGMSYSLRLMDLAAGKSREVVAGNVGFTVPTWSPDGSSLAFVRPADSAAVRVVEGETPAVLKANVWVLRLRDGALTQMTNLPGQVRSPQWANDGRTLAFITDSGQVGLVSLEAPGHLWAAGAPGTLPVLSAAFFVP